jgi:hypothetical protein
MQLQSDPNVIYGGDRIVMDDEVMQTYISLGDMIVKDLKLGESKKSLVSVFAFRR